MRLIQPSAAVGSHQCSVRPRHVYCSNLVCRRIQRKSRLHHIYCAKQQYYTAIPVYVRGTYLNSFERNISIPTNCTAGKACARNLQVMFDVHCFIVIYICAKYVCIAVDEHCRNKCISYRTGAFATIYCVRVFTSCDALFVI